jgi:putative nucleotidyltransferase with HDIG domain
LLVNLLHHRYQGMICPGIIDGARKRDYNLIAFVGKSLKSRHLFEEQENVVYELACGKNLDGLLILSGAIGNYLSVDVLKGFCRRFEPLPMVCIATPIEGIPSIWTDNKIGMREIVTHFIHHKHRRIAFLRGPTSNPEAEIRYRVFKEVLAENRVPLIPELIVEGNFEWLSGIQGVRTILDERKASFDALLAANDEMLIGVYRELVRRGIKVPGEVALGGFDNIDETKMTAPPITTVSQPLYEEGEKAVDFLADRMEGKPVPEIYAFPARLIVRQSCGCGSNGHDADIGLKIPASKNGVADMAISDLQRQRILDQIRGDVELQLDAPREFAECVDLLESYVDAYIRDLKNRDNKLLKMVHELTSGAKGDDVNLDFFRILVSKLYQYVSPLVVSSRGLTERAFLEYNSALALLLDSLSRHSRNLLIQSRDYNWSMLAVTKALSTTFDFERLRDVMRANLTTLGISFCLISLYEQNGETRAVPTPLSRVFLDFQAGAKDHDNHEGTVFDSRELVPFPLPDGKKPFCLAIFPLVNENNHFGFIAFDYDYKSDPIIYETLQGHVSASLKGATLLRTVKVQSEDLTKQRDELSNSLSRLRQIMGGFIDSMSRIVEARDPFTAGHQIRVADLARTIATEMGLPREQIEGIRVSGVLHDIGKIYIPSQILNKPGRLMDVEFNLIKTHPQIGYDILKSVDWPWPVAEIVLQHHERMDGSGYPAGLVGDRILIEAKIICVADVVEAMASHRPYRPALGVEKALEEISKMRGKLYDPAVVDCCLKIFREKGFFFDAAGPSFRFPHPSE